MKIRTLLTFVGLLVFNQLLAQAENQENYFKLVKVADSLYKAKAYKASAETFKEAFDQLGRKAYKYDRYNAACAYAMANEKDSAFFHLYRLAESKMKYNEYEHITKDTDLVSLHSDERWEKLISIVKTNKDEYEKDFDKPLIAELDSIYNLDQVYRHQLDDIEDKYGRESAELKAQWKLISKTDSTNLIRIKEILDTRGWLGPKVVDYKGNSCLFLVIQHSDLETQVKYLPMMEEAVKQHNANASSFALLKDRVALGQGKLQIYGSQIGRIKETGEYYLLPLEDPDNVNARREEMGLGSIEDYVGNWNLVWNVEEYKKKLPEYIELDKVRRNSIPK